MNFDKTIYITDISDPVEEQKAIEKHKSLLQWALSLTDEQKDFLFNAGFYNDTVKGYLIAAAINARSLEPDEEKDKAFLTYGQIKTLLSGLEWAFSEKNKAAADELYSNF